MTRKEALLKAIIYLQELKDESLRETIVELEQLVQVLPVTEWDLATILDSIDQFYLEQGRLPIPTEFKGWKLPSHSVLHHRAHLSPSMFLKTYYSELYGQQCKCNFVSKYRHLPAEHWLETFKVFMQAYPKVTSIDYDRYRKKDTPCLRTLLKIGGVQTWNQLLVKVGLPVKYNSKGTNYTATIMLKKNMVQRNYTNQNIEQLREMMDQLKRGSSSYL